MEEEGTVISYSELSQFVAPSSKARSRIVKRSSSLGGVPYKADIPMRPKPKDAIDGPSAPS
jgi:hypothetical protein